MNTHHLKTIPDVWDAIERGEKRFEVRRNDRFFQRGDIVVLYRSEPYALPDFEEPTLKFKIGWFLQGGQYGIDPQYCVFQLEEVEVQA